MERDGTNISSTTDYTQDDLSVRQPDEDHPMGYGVEVKKYNIHSGPLPSPETLRAYDETVPGAGERILRMAEKQLDHNIDADNATIRHISNSAKRGQWLGFILALVLIGTGIGAMVLEQTAVACTIFGTAIIGVVSSFVSNIIKSKREENKK